MSLNLRYRYSSRGDLGFSLARAAAVSVSLKPSGRFAASYDLGGGEVFSEHRRARFLADYAEQDLPTFAAEVGGVLVLSPDGERLHRGARLAIRRRDEGHALVAIGPAGETVIAAEGPRTWRLPDGRRLSRLLITTDHTSALPLKEAPRGRVSALAAERRAA